MNVKYERNFAQNTTFLGYTEKQLETELNSFIRIPRSLLTNKDITINGIILYSRLRAYSNRKYDDWCDRHFDRIAEQTGLFKNKLKQELDKLVALGLIEIKNMPKEFKSGSNKYRIRVIKDLLSADDLSFIKMPTRMFWYPELDNKMRLLYSYIITYKDFSFSSSIYIASNKWAEKLPMDRRTISNTLNKMKDLNILYLSSATKQKGMAVSVKKDFTKMSDLEDEWIHTHSIEAEKINNSINIEEEQVEEKIKEEIIESPKEEVPVQEKPKLDISKLTEQQKQVRLEWRDFLQLCDTKEYKVYDEINHTEIIFDVNMCRNTYESWKSIYPTSDEYQLHHEFMKEWYKDYGLKKVKEIDTKKPASDDIYQAV